MNTTASRSPSFLLRAVGVTLRQDRLAQITVAVFVLTFALYGLPFLSPGQRAALSWIYAPLLFLVLVVSALLYGRRQISERVEQRFWLDLTIGFSCWLLAILLRLQPMAADSVGRWFLEEALYALYYIFLVLAAMREPDMGTRWRPLDLERRLAWPTAVIMVLGLFSYFVLVPRLSSSQDELSLQPAFYAYLTLDFFLAAKLCYLARTARAPRWQALYSLVALAFTIQLAVDLLEAVVSGRADWVWGSQLDPVWNLSFVACVIAARMRHAPVLPPRGNRNEAEPIVERLTGLSGQAIIFALAIPLLHFALHQLALLPAHARMAREVFAFWWLCGLGMIALVQHHVLRRRTRSLWMGQQRTERRLRDREQNLRVVLERQDADEVIRAAEQRFAAVFYHSPDGLMISTQDEGRFLDVNPTAQRLTGYRREALLGSTSVQLDMWGSEEERAAFLRTIKRPEGLHDHELVYTERRGRKRVVLASFEAIHVEGTPCILTIMRDITARKLAAAAVTAQAALLEGARAAIVVLDASGCIADWNPGAARLFGWPASAVIDRSAAALLLPTEEEDRVQLIRFLRTKASATSLLWTTTQGGEAKQIEARCALVCDESGALRARILFARGVRAARSIDGTG